MLPVPCYLYDLVSVRWRNPGSREWQDFDALSLKDLSLGEVCDLLGHPSMEVLARADDIRVVNSSLLVAECKKHKFPVQTFARVREVAEAEGLLDVRFYSIGFGPGINWVHR